jgi:hypothetical protein
VIVGRCRKDEDDDGSLIGERSLASLRGLREELQRAE